MELPKGYKKLKVERTCQSGFFWAYEFLNYSNRTENKNRLHALEDYMKKLIERQQFKKNFVEHQFVAVTSSSARGVVRGYTLCLISNETYEVLLIDYGNIEKVNAKDLRDLPDYASVEKLPAQSWRIGIYGVKPVHVQFEFGQPSDYKTVGESWNGKDIKFIANLLKNSDTIDFHEIKKVGEYKFGYIYLEDPETKRITTLQKLLVDSGYAVEVNSKEFDKGIPTIVRRIRSSRDHESFPTGEENDENMLTSDCEDHVTFLDEGNESATSQSTEQSSAKPKSSELPTAISSMSKSQSSSSISPTPKAGRGRGEIMRNIKLVKPPPSQPAVMVGRLPMNSEQFDDSMDSIYYDAVSTTLDSTRRESTSSIECLDHNTASFVSRNQSSNSVEILTPKNNSQTRTSSLVTPPNDPAILSYRTHDEIPTIDLTLPTSQPNAISLITPTSSPRDKSSLSESDPGTSQSTSSLRRGKGRGELFASLSLTSTGSLSMKDAVSYESLNEKLSQLKLNSTPVQAPRGRAVLLNRVLNDLASQAPKCSNKNTNGLADSTKPDEIDFAIDIAPLNSTPTASNTNEENKSFSDQFADDTSFEDAEFDDEDRLITKIMVLGNEGVCRFRPRFKINDFNLHQDVIKRAGQLRLQLVRSQRYMIPAMLTRKNVTLIGPSKQGKTVSCLLALFSLLKDKNFYKALPVGVGPRAIVLCPFSSQCEEIERQCRALNKSSYLTSSEIPSESETLRLNVAYGCGKEAEKDKLNELTHGYDIVICTPSCLLRLLQTPEMMNLKRLCHLVLDDADTLFSSYKDEVTQILQEAHRCGKKCENGLILPQRVIISKEWIPSIKHWIKKDVTEQLGILLIASYSEAAIFANVQGKLRFIDGEDRKRNDLLNYLQVEQSNKSTVIVFNEIEDMNETYSWLKSKCIRPLLKVGYSLGTVDDIVMEWKRSSERNEYPIICCTDNTLHDLYIHEANSLIHYNLPLKERGFFTERFSVLLYRLAGPPDFYSPGKMPLTFSKSDTLIYIGREDQLQFPAVIKLATKLRIKIPTSVQLLADELLHARELEKNLDKFCENYKKFGCCSNEELCKSRHYLTEQDEPASDIPMRGFVKMQILQVYSASHYCVRLLQHRYGTNEKWSEIKTNIHPAVLNAKVNMYFSNHSKRSMFLCKNIGDIAAIETTTDMFKRVKVLELIMDEKNEGLRTVKVKFMDDGKIDDVRPSVLVKLSDELASIPATTVDIFLCNVLPVDRDIEWGDIISNKVRERIETLRDSEGVHFIGEIQLVSGRDVWIDPLQCHKHYDQGKEIVVMITSMCKDLLKKKFAVENPEHLPKLLKMYESAGFTRPSEIVIDPVPESGSNVEKTDVTPSPSNNLVGNVSEKSTTETLNESSSFDSSVVSSEPEQERVFEDEPETLAAPSDFIVVSSKPEQGLGVYEYEENNWETHTPEEDWVLEDEPQTLAAPVYNTKENSTREYASDCDEGSDEGFDCFFVEDELKALFRSKWPGLLSYCEQFDGNQSTASNVASKISDRPAILSAPSHVSPSVNHESATPLIPHSRVLNPPISEEIEDTTKYILKPNVEWYQDSEFIYMHIALNVEDHVVRFDQDRIYFRASYNERTYEFNELLYTAIEESNAKSYKSSVIIVIKMEKVIKRNKWPRIFKNKASMGWIRKSLEHFDDDVEINDSYWDDRLNIELALKKPEIPKDFSMSSYTNTNITIYPDGYNLLEHDSEEDSDAVGCDVQDD